MCKIAMSFARVYRAGVWFGFVRFALFLAVVLCWVDRWFDSWVLLGLFCLLRLTQQVRTARTSKSGLSRLRVLNLTLLKADSRLLRSYLSQRSGFTWIPG